MTKSLLAVILAILISGCGVPKKSSSKEELLDGPFKPLVDNLVKDETKESVGELKMSAEASDSLVDTLSRVLGGSGELTWNSDTAHQIDIGNNGTVTIQPGTKIKYRTSEFGTVMEFESPKPVIKAPAGPIKVKVSLVSVDFHKDNTGTAVLDTGLLGIKKQHNFKIDFDKPEEPQGSVASKPVVWCYVTDGCGPCNQAKADIQAAGSSLPFEVKFTKNAPSWVTSYPTFHWNDSSGKSWKQVGWPGIEHLKRQVLGNASSNRSKTTSYQVRSDLTGPIWSYSGGDTKPALIHHLLNDGIHRGKFKRQQLEKLSRDQLVMLHSKDHNEN